MSTTLLEYMNIHLISLMQDLEELENQMEALDPDSKDFRDLDFEFNHTSGQIMATRHLLSVGKDILNGDIQGKGY